MALAAEPRPAELPLPGGSAGATVRLHPLLIARMTAPVAMGHRPPGRFAALEAYGIKPSPREEVPVVAFLVEHPTAGSILIDTGFHSSQAVNPKKPMGLASTIFKDLQMDPDESAAARLRAKGVQGPGLVVMTHLHMDHAGAISEFPDATFVLSKQEWNAGSRLGQRHGYARRQYDHAFDWRTIDFEDGDLDSFATFGRGADLFGDGSVQLVFTPGHTFGHCSVVLRLKGREALICGDAAYTRETLAGEALPFLTADEHLFKRSLREMQQFTEQAPRAVVIPGHDMAAWRVLDSVYE